MATLNLDNLEFKTPVHLTPLQSIHYQKIVNLPTFRDAVSMGIWEVAEQFFQDNGLPPLRTLHPELYGEAVPGENVELNVVNETVKPIFDKLKDIAPISREEIESIRQDLREGTQEIYIVKLHLDRSQSMTGYEEVYPVVDSLCHNAFFESVVWKKAKELRRQVFFGEEFFNHENFVRQYPVTLDRFTQLRKLPSTSCPVPEGLTDLRTKLACAYRSIEFEDQILEDLNINIRRLQTVQIIYSDGRHDMFNADKDSPITMQELQTLHQEYIQTSKESRGDYGRIVVLAADKSALEFFQEIGFKRGKNLIYAKGKGQDYGAFMRNIRHAAGLVSKITSQSMSASA